MSRLVVQPRKKNNISREWGVRGVFSLTIVAPGSNIDYSDCAVRIEKYPFCAMSSYRPYTLLSVAIRKQTRTIYASMRLCLQKYVGFAYMCVNVCALHLDFYERIPCCRLSNRVPHNKIVPIVAFKRTMPLTVSGEIDVVHTSCPHLTLLNTTA